MGLNFHKSIKVNDTTKVNLNKKSASVTVGTKGVHHTVSTSGRQTTTFSLPGTGLSYSMSSGNTGSKKKSKKSKMTKTVISVICSIVALVFIILGVLKYFGVGSGKSGSLTWRKDEYSVSVGSTVNLILDVKTSDNISNAKASDFTIEVDNQSAVSVEFKQAYSETVHFTVKGLEEGAASVKITYNGKTSAGVTVNVTG